MNRTAYNRAVELERLTSGLNSRLTRLRRAVNILDNGNNEPVDVEICSGAYSVEVELESIAECIKREMVTLEERIAAAQREFESL